MPFAPHYRVTALGRLGAGGGAERFSYGINLGRPDGGPTVGLAPNAGFWNDIAEDVRSFHGSGLTRIADKAVLTEVKIARIGADGKYVEDPLTVNVADTPGGIVQDVTAFILPQSALAVSLVTARRGPTGKGRFYIPMPVLALDATTLQAETALINNVATSAQTFLNNIDNAPGIDVLGIEVVVASTKGYNSDVTGVRVGRVVDTIRTRRNEIPEAYPATLPVG